MVVIKNLKAEPDQAPNDGTGWVRLNCTVFTPQDDASIEGAWIDLRSLGGPAEHPLQLDPQRCLSQTNEGVYSCTAQVPLLADTGRHDPQIRARDSAGNVGRARPKLEVQYSRPDYSGPVDSKRNRAALEQVCAAPLSGGNRIEPLSDGAAALDKRLELIRSARTQINLQTYIMDDEGQSGRLMEALFERAAAGVEVNVILNSMVQFAASPLSALRLKFKGVLRELQSLGRRIEQELSRREGRESMRQYFSEIMQGVERGMRDVNLLIFDAARLRKSQGPTEERTSWATWLREYTQRPPKQREGRMSEWLAGFQGPGGLPALPLLDYAIHEKILVVDGCRAVVGGRNLDDRFFLHWLDLDLSLEGPLVERVQQGFLKSFDEFAGDDPQRPRPMQLLPHLDPAGEQSAQFVQSRPWNNELYALHDLVTLIQMARERIWIGSQYVVLTDCLLRRALLDAVRRGVQVRVVTNSYETCREVAFGGAFFVSFNHLRELVRGGIEVYLVNGAADPEQPQPYYHSKEFLIDGRVAAVGSFNLSLRSCYIESENLINVFDPELVAKLEQLYSERLAGRTTRLTEELLRELQQRFSERVEIAKFAELLY